MSKTKLKPIVVAVLIAGLSAPLISAPVYANAIQEQVSVTPVRSITPREEEIISSAGAKVLRHIAQARADINRKNAESVTDELNQADKLLDIIGDALPSRTVKDRIWVAKTHLEYEDTQEVLPDLIPISASLDEMVDIMPVEAAKARLDQARNHLKAGDKTSARKSLDETDAALQYFEVDLPLTATRRLVADARADLAKKNFDAADKALKSAEDSVVFVSFGIQQPLFAAKAALVESVEDSDAGANDLAKVKLQEAIGDLKVAAQSTDTPTREAAQQLLAEAQPLFDDKAPASDLGSRVHRLLEHTRAYADRSVQYMTTGWERYRAEGHPFKSDLIEARLHVANARIDLFTGHESDRARQELDTANGYLDKAEQTAGRQPGDPDYKSRIGDLRKSIAALSVERPTANVTDYAMLQRQLDELIARL